MPPPEAARALGPDWKVRIGLPKVALRTWLIPDWEFPGYWLFKDNRSVSCAQLASLLGHRLASARELDMLRGRSSG